MAEDNSGNDRPLVERWLEEQQEWQKTMLRYMDSMANNEEFLVHLGNAMRGSLLAGKPYPGTAPPAAEPEPKSGPEAAASDERLDRILFTLHEIQGQLNDLQLSVEALNAAPKPPSDPADTRAEPAAVLPSTSDDAAAHSSEPARRGSDKSRRVRSGSPRTKLRRSQPRGGFGRRGGGAD